MAKAKRLFDFIVATLALFTLSPLLLLLAFLVGLNSGFPILFHQRRPGLHGEPFTLYKFRTMTDERAVQLETVLRGAAASKQKA